MRESMRFCLLAAGPVHQGGWCNEAKRRTALRMPCRRFCIRMNQ